MSALLTITAKKPFRRESSAASVVSTIYPFNVGTSRLRAKPDLYAFDLRCEKIADLLAKKDTGASFEDCCLRRARELLSLDKPSYFFSYSGGIDSTTMLVSLLRTWSKADLARVTIRMTNHSLYENPAFFNSFVAKGPWKLESAMRDPSQMLVEEDGLLVTGDMGDQLFGSSVLIQPVAILGDGILSEPYQQGVPKVIGAMGYDVKAGWEVLAHFEPCLSECPTPVRTTAEYLWWFEFSQKWQNVKYKFLESVTWDKRATYGTHVRHFFDTEAFQIWSLHHPDEKIRDDWASYKYPAKNFIYDFFKDPSQTALAKIESLEKLYHVKQMRYAVTSDLQDVNTPEELETYAIR